MRFNNAVLFFIRASLLLSTISVVKVNGQIELSAGEYHTCAFERTSAELKCWGYNGYYQMNTSTQTDQLTPIVVSLLPVNTDAGDGQAGGWSNCMVSQDLSDVSCIGYNRYGQLGNGSTYSFGSSPAAMSLPANTEIGELVMHRFHTCMTTVQKSLLCTGRNHYGQLGVNDNNDRSVPTQVGGGYIVEVAAVGKYHTCFVDDVLKLLCMGGNEYGQLGIGNNINQNIPTAVGLGERTMAKLSCGDYHTCLITDLAAVLCMGGNEYGQLGIGTNADKNLPTPVSQQEDDAVAIAAGAYHTCFIISNDKVFCIGRNHYGQLGNSGTTDSNVPIEVDMPLSVTPIKLALGDGHSCVSTASNQVYCWGYNDYGQIGDGSTTEKMTPTLVLSIDWLVSTPAPVASTPAPVPSTAAPVASTPAPVPSTAAPVASPPTESQCSDSTLRLRTFNGLGDIVWRGCSWVKNKPYRCLDPGHASHCRETCDLCNTCEDSTLRFKVVKDDGSRIARSCLWVSNKQTQIRCGYDGVADTCPKTCGSCS